jgi:hypothetical protein
MAEHIYFRLCSGLGRLLRAGRYSKVRIERRGEEPQVRKQRAFYAPLLIRIGDALVRVLDTGTQVLPQRDWEERERQIYRRLYGASIRIEDDGTLVLPCLPGRTLATLLEDSQLEGADRERAIELAVVALARFHRLGLTHGDAMAENVLVDLDAGIASWFDFETVHDPRRSMTWRRADDVRALLATSLLRAAPERFSRILHIVLENYRDDEVARLLAESFTSVWRRPLVFHLGQAASSFQSYTRIGALLRGGPANSMG